MNNYEGHEEYIISAKKALNRFIEFMGHDEWRRRRSKVVEYFNSLPRLGDKPENDKSNKLFHRYVAYDDWMAWYMYLVDSLVDRPAVDEPMQSARIYPFFAAIGRQIAGAESIHGIQDRISNLLNERKNQPDSTLFELLVALTYHRNGYQVRFIAETPGIDKRPDFEALKPDQRFLIECKRLAKATDYSEAERLEWIKRWEYLLAVMQGLGIPCHADITFTIPVEDFPEDGLVKIFIDYVKAGHFKTGIPVEAKGVIFQAKPINMERVAAHFSKFHVRHNSPQFIALLADGYLPYGSYTNAYRPSEISIIGPDDGLHVLNEFIGGLHEAYSAKWECIAEVSIEKKAKDVRSILSKAVAQIPDNESGIVHIGYETLNGPEVEFRRHEKIRDTVHSFDCGEKDIQSVFFHALQPLSKIEDFDCAETVSFFGKAAGLSERILPDMLILVPPSLGTKQKTHWQEDADNKDNLVR